MKSKLIKVRLKNRVELNRKLYNKKHHNLKLLNIIRFSYQTEDQSIVIVVVFSFICLLILEFVILVSKLQHCL